MADNGPSVCVGFVCGRLHKWPASDCVWFVFLTIATICFSLQQKQQKALILLTIMMISRIHCISPGYSFAKFKGPVSGPERKVVYSDGDPYASDHLDYVAQPDYHFAYGVQDPKSKNHQSRQETRHGDTVHGEYRSVQMAVGM